MQLLFLSLSFNLIKAMYPKKQHNVLGYDLDYWFPKWPLLPPGDSGKIWRGGGRPKEVVGGERMAQGTE